MPIERKPSMAMPKHSANRIVKATLAVLMVTIFLCGMHMEK